MSWTHCFTPVPATIVCEASTLVVPVANTDRYYIHLVSFTRGEERRQKDEMKATANILVNLHFHNFSSSSSSSQLEPNAERHKTRSNISYPLSGERTKESEKREKKTKGENRNERRHKHKVEEQKDNSKERKSFNRRDGFLFIQFTHDVEMRHKKIKTNKTKQKKTEAMMKANRFIGSLSLSQPNALSCFTEPLPMWISSNIH